MADTHNVEKNPAAEPSATNATTPSAVVAGARGEDALQVGDLETKRKGQGIGQQLLDVFLPNRAVSPTVMQIIIGVQILVVLLLWLNSPFKVLPRPQEVVRALGDLWMRGLGHELLANSLRLNLAALAWSSLISLGLAYLTVIPFFRPLVVAISKGRFLSLVGFSFLFSMMGVPGGRPLQTTLLVFAVSVFYVTSMASVIASIPKGDFDHARTLRMSEWQVVWEVVILGTLSQAFEVLRQNAAIGWMMLTMVEGIARGGGGVGVMLLDQQKYLRLDGVFAIQLLILFVGLLQDYAIAVVRRIVCPHADLTLERK